MSDHGDETFAVGDRGFSHYTMKWATVMSDPDDQGWFTVENDDGTRDLLDAWRFVRPGLAERYGYGEDPALARQEKDQ